MTTDLDSTDELRSVQDGLEASGRRNFERRGRRGTDDVNKTGMPSAATVEERFWWEAVVDFAGVFGGHSALVELPEYPLVPLPLCTSVRSKFCSVLGLDFVNVKIMNGFSSKFSVCTPSTSRARLELSRSPRPRRVWTSPPTFHCGHHHSRTSHGSRGFRGIPRSWV